MAKEKKKDDVLNIMEKMYNSEEAPFTRFKISIRTIKNERIDAFWGCVFPNSKIVIYQPNSDMVAVYSNLDLFINEFTVTLGYDITFLDNVVKTNNRLH